MTVHRHETSELNSQGHIFEQLFLSIAFRIRSKEERMKFKLQSSVWQRLEVLRWLPRCIGDAE
jgi:hypothetical protein